MKKNYYLFTNKEMEREQKTEPKNILYREAKNLAILTGLRTAVPDYNKSTRLEMLESRNNLRLIWDFQRNTNPAKLIKIKEYQLYSRAELWNEYKKLKKVRGLPEIKYNKATKEVLLRILSKPNIEVVDLNEGIINILVKTLKNTSLLLKKRIHAFNRLRELDFDFLKIPRKIMIDFFKSMSKSGYYLLNFKINGQEHFSAINQKNHIKALEWVLQDSIESVVGERYGSDLLLDIDYSKVEDLKIIQQLETKKLREQKGDFFPYYNTSLEIDLQEEEIFTKEQFLNTKLTENCFISVLKKSKLLSDSEINSIKLEYASSSTFSKKHIKLVASKYDICFKLSEVDNKQQIRTRNIGDIKSKRNLVLNMYKEHYFISRNIPYTSFYVKNYNDIIEKYPKGHKKYEKSKLASKYNSKDKIYKFEGEETNNLVIIREMFNTGMFVQDGEFLTHNNFSIETDTVCLDNLENEQKLVEPKGSSSKATNNTLVFYADLETDTSSGEHIPVMSQIVSENEEIPQVYTGETVILDMFKYVEKTIQSKFGKQTQTRKWTGKYKADGFGLVKNIDGKYLFSYINQYGYASGEFYEGKETEDRFNNFLKVTKKTLDEYNEDCKEYIYSKEKTKAIIYFHNAKYDFSVLKPYIQKVYKICRKDGAFYSVNINVLGINIEIRDSFKIITAGIKKMPKMFKLPAKYHKNEAIAYSYHTVDRITKNIENVNVYKTFLDHKLHKEFDRILENKVVECEYCPIKKTFNPFKYYKEYGILDVLILKESMIRFNKELKSLFPEKNLDTIDFLTISKIALTSVYDKISNIQHVCGNLRKFISKAVYGGRVHVNEKYLKQIIKKILSDFDACSMYPSAIIRICKELGFPTQKWTKIIDFKNTLSLEDRVYYVVKIRLTKINKKIQIPVVCIKDKSGTSNYVNELPPCGEVEMTVDKITLEDMIRFQDIEYDFIEGIEVSMVNSNKTLGDEIMRLYKERLKVKSSNPAMGELIKLILNSIYGKTCPRQNFYTEECVSGEKINDYIVKNFHNIENIEKINIDVYICKVFKPDSSFSPNIIGCMILSMSKRIMNEVFQICDNNNYPVYYTDTDSMHIDKLDIPKISKIYYEMYGKELIGKMPEQFHSDFKLIGSDDKEIDPDNVISTKSIFLGKKCYIDSLEGIDKDNITCEGLHYRMKGISEKGLINHCNVKYGGDMFKLYKSLAQDNKEEITLNFNEFNPSFEYTLTGVKFRDSGSFKRTVYFGSNGEEEEEED